jgi:hypothetical protein
VVFIEVLERISGLPDLPGLPRTIPDISPFYDSEITAHQACILFGCWMTTGYTATATVATADLIRLKRSAQMALCLAAYRLASRGEILTCAGVAEEAWKAEPGLYQEIQVLTARGQRERTTEQ